MKLLPDDKRARRWSIGGMAGVVVVALGATAWGLLHNRGPRPDAPPAQIV
jgi:hypothetical protein